MNVAPLVLVVDDDKVVRSVVQKILDREGYILSFAATCKEAMELISMRKPDIILLDIELPDMNGVDFCRVLKSDKILENIPVIFMTANDRIKYETKGLSSGGIDFISKPFEASVLKLRLKNHLEMALHENEHKRIIYEQTCEIYATREAIISAMAYLSEFRDVDTGNHIFRVKSYVKLLSKRFQKFSPDSLDSEDVSFFEMLSPVHDIGKVAVPDHILLKTGPLTQEEFDIMKQHTVIGGEVITKTASKIGKSKFMDIARDIALYHHEKYDGTGYPKGLKGEEIPLAARVVTICDVYDALTSQRPYKKAFSHEEAARIILMGDEKTKPEHFDPVLLKLFCELLPEFRLINKLYN